MATAEGQRCLTAAPGISLRLVKGKVSGRSSYAISLNSYLQIDFRTLTFQSGSYNLIHDVYYATTLLTIYYTFVRNICFECR